MSNLDDLGFSQEEQRLDAALARAQIRIRDLEKTLGTYTGMLAAERDRADRAEASRSVVPPEWQPIETAPKDGTAILGFWDKINPVTSAAYGITRWHDGFWVSNDDDCEDWDEPSHWRHLPPAPDEGTP